MLLLIGQDKTIYKTQQIPRGTEKTLVAGGSAYNFSIFHVHYTIVVIIKYQQ